LQTAIFKKQWQEMRSGGTDTHDLAIQSRHQADVAKAQAEQAQVQTEKMAESLAKTDGLLKTAIAQAKATNELAVQTTRAADLAQQSLAQFRREQRPWIFPSEIEAKLLGRHVWTNNLTTAILT